MIHEIKNPLTPVGLAADTLKTAWGRDPARFADVFPSAIDMILGAVRDLKELIGGVLALLAPAADARRAARPERDRASTRSRRTRRRRATSCGSSSTSRPSLPQVEADADQIKRVLLNVINNALEAMAERGRRAAPAHDRRAGRCPDPRRGRRPGRRGRRAHLRAALHDEGQGHGPRPRDRAPDRRRARRHDRGREHARAGHERPDLPARGAALAAAPFEATAMSGPGKEDDRTDAYRRAEGLATLLEVSKRLAATAGPRRRCFRRPPTARRRLAGLETAAIYLAEEEMARLWATTPPLPAGFPDALRIASLADHPHAARSHLDRGSFRSSPTSRPPI